VDPESSSSAGVPVCGGDASKKAGKRIANWEKKGDVLWKWDKRGGSQQIKNSQNFNEKVP